MDRLIDFVIEMWKLVVGAFLILLVSLWFVMGWIQYQLCSVSHFGWCDHIGTNSAVIILLAMLAVAGWIVVKLFKRFPKTMIALSLAASVPVMALMMLVQDELAHPSAKVQSTSQSVPVEVQEPAKIVEPSVVHEFEVPVAPEPLAVPETPVVPEIVTAQPQEEVVEIPVMEVPEPVVAPVVVAPAPYGSPEWAQQDPMIPDDMKKKLACQLATFHGKKCAS